MIRVSILDQGSAVFHAAASARAERAASGRRPNWLRWPTPPLPSALHPDLVVLAQSRDLTDKAIRRGVFHNVPELVATIENYLDVNNTNPKPFVWTVTAEQILAKVARGRVTLEQVRSQK
jgi:hypothetical protein